MNEVIDLRGVFMEKQSARRAREIREVKQKIIEGMGCFRDALVLALKYEIDQTSQVQNLTRAFEFIRLINLGEKSWK